MNGPTTVTVPARTYNSCNGCYFFKRTLFRSGRNPEYENYCTSPKAKAKGLTTLPDTGVTPDWCPELHSEQPVIPAVCRHCGKPIDPEQETLPGHAQSCNQTPE